jgi:hypothetical protein
MRPDDPTIRPPFWEQMPYWLAAWFDATQSVILRAFRQPGEWVPDPATWEPTRWSAQWRCAGYVVSVSPHSLSLLGMTRKSGFTIHDAAVVRGLPGAHKDDTYWVEANGVPNKADWQVLIRASAEIAVRHAPNPEKPTS